MLFMLLIKWRLELFAEKNGLQLSLVKCGYWDKRESKFEHIGGPTSRELCEVSGSVVEFQQL